VILSPYFNRGERIGVHTSVYEEREREMIKYTRVINKREREVILNPYIDRGERIGTHISVYEEREGER
jgi:hypothetical protein